ncbi:hypothetical protein [Streptomyces griseosporeus]
MTRRPSLHHPSQEARTAASAEAPVRARATVPPVVLRVSVQVEGLLSCHTGCQGSAAAGPGAASVCASIRAGGEVGTPAVTIATWLCAVR